MGPVGGLVSETGGYRRLVVVCRRFDRHHGADAVWRMDGVRIWSSPSVSVAVYVNNVYLSSRYRIYSRRRLSLSAPSGSGGPAARGGPASARREGCGRTGGRGSSSLHRSYLYFPHARGFDLDDDFVFSSTRRLDVRIWLRSDGCVLGRTLI